MRSDAAAGPSAALPVAALIATIAITAVLHPLWMVFRFGGAEAARTVDDLAPIAASLLAVVLTARRAARRADGATSAGWALLAGSCAGLAGGEVIFGVYELVLHVDAPFPSLADASYVVGATLAIPAVLLLGGRTLLTSGLRIVLDAGIVAISVFLVSWMVVLHTVWSAGGSNPLTYLLGLFYPVSDIVTVVIVVTTVAYARRPNPSLLVVGAGLVCISSSDTACSYLTAAGQHDGANPIDVGWVLGHLLLGLGALVGREHRRAEEAALAQWQMALPYVPMAVASGVILSWFAGQRPIDTFSLLLMAGLVMLVLARQLTAVIASQTLAIRLESASAERELVIEHAPVGICRLDPGQRLLAANRTFQSMLGMTWGELQGRSLLELVAPVDRQRVAGGYAALLDGDSERVEVESRLVRSDGTILRAAQLAAAIRDAAGRVESVIAIVENVTERRRQTELAANIQRQLLPQAGLQIPGYELAGLCLPASDVAGDFYDWVVTDGGCVDLTVADVMGKGVGAGLVMATLRAVLRAAPAGLPPAERVRIAAESMVGIDVGLFVTMFHARLDPATGLLRYVDAGHGYCCIRRPDGELVRLEVCSMPLGVTELSEMREGTGWLEPGDTLVVFSDGLVEMPERTAELAEFSPDFESAAGAADTVVRMMARTPTQPDDDVTLVVLRRLGGEVVPLRIPAELPPRARPPDQRSAASSSS